MADKEVYSQGLWIDLKNENLLPVGGTLMRSCEQELRDLVQNIEIKVKNRETGLKQQMRKVHKQFEKKNQECQQQRLNIDENSKKTLTLETQVAKLTAEKENLEEVHEKEMTKLKSKAAQLRSEHEQLHKSFLRKMQKMEKYHKSNNSKDGERKLEVQQLSEKLTECENQLKVVQEQKDILEEDFDSVNSEYQTLQDRCSDLEAVNEKLANNIEESERLRQDGEQEIYKLNDLIKEQSDALVDFGKSDDLLKRAVIALRIDVNTRIAAIKSLQVELEQSREDQAARMKVDNELMETLRLENQHLQQELLHHKDDCTNLKEQLRVLKAEKIVLEKKYFDEREKLKNYERETQSKINDLKTNEKESFGKDLASHKSRGLVDSQEQQKNVLENADHYQEKVGSLDHLNTVFHEQLVEEFRKQTEEEKEEEETEEDEDEVAVEELEQKEAEKKKNKEVNVLSQLTNHNQIGDTVDQSTVHRPPPTANQNKVHHVRDKIHNQPQQTDNVFHVSQSQLKDFLQKEQIYRRDWEDNFSKELHHIWHNTEVVFERYINSL